MNPIVETILGGVVILLGVAGAYLITKIASYWSSKRDSIVNMIAADFGFTNNQFMLALLNHVANVVDDVVAAMNSKFKPELIKASEDGKLSDDDKITLRDKALELILTELPDSIWDELAAIVGDREEYVKTLIENSVEKQKNAPLNSVLEATADLQPIIGSTSND